MIQMAWNRARRIFPTNPDLVDILEDMDSDFGKSDFGIHVGHDLWQNLESKENKK